MKPGDNPRLAMTVALLGLLALAVLIYLRIRPWALMSLIAIVAAGVWLWIGRPVPAAVKALRLSQTGDKTGRVPALKWVLGGLLAALVYVAILPLDSGDQNASHVPALITIAALFAAAIGALIYLYGWGALARSLRPNSIARAAMFTGGTIFVAALGSCSVMQAGMVDLPPTFNLSRVTTAAVVFALPAAVVWFVGGFVSNWFGGEGPSIFREHRRGARQSPADEYVASLDRKFPDRPAPALLAGLPFPPGNERLHTSISAATGSGKTVALKGLLASIRARGDRAVILDNNSEFMTAFRQPGDLVMSAFADDSPGWRLSNEARKTYDWDRLADSFVPQGSDNAAEWHGMAKSLFASVGSGFSEVMDGTFPNAEFQRLLTAAEARELAPLVAGTTAEVLAGEDEHNARRLQSVRMSFIEHLKAWRYVKDGDFSFRDWIASDSAEWMFLPYSDYEMKLARDLLAGWVDIMVTSALDRPDSKPPARTTWIIIDELNSLGEIAALIVGTTRLRKVGIAIVIAVQDFAQLRETYGANRAETLMNNFSNKLVLRTTEANAAEYLSKQLGEREMLEHASSHSMSRDGDSTSRSQSIVTERLVLPSEIQKLPDLEGYLDFAGDWPVIKVKVPLPAQP